VTTALPATPIEKKVQAGTATAAISGLILWVLGTYVFKGNVPDALVSWIYFLVPGVLTFLAGYFTKHTHRPDLPTPAILVPAMPKLQLSAAEPTDVPPKS
jgi:hypothetical protein